MKTSEPWMGEPLQLKLFAADSPASRFPMPGSDEARQMTVISGRRCAASLPKSDPLGSLARTLLESSAWNSTRCYLTWKHSDTPAGRSLFLLQPSMPRTSGDGSGLLPTPSASDPNLERRAQTAQNTYRTSWGSVRVQRRDGRSSNLGLAGAVMWPTPTSVSGHAVGRLDEWGGASARKKVREMTTPEESSGQLNPQWVEWLMGYPIEWTALEDSAMPSSRKSRKRLGA